MLHIDETDMKEKEWGSINTVYSETSKKGKNCIG